MSSTDPHNIHILHTATYIPTTTLSLGAMNYQKFTKISQNNLHLIIIYSTKDARNAAMMHSEMKLVQLAAWSNKSLKKVL